MHVDGARVAGKRVAPDALEQLVAREYEAFVVEQLPEQVELLGRELDLLLADLHLAAAGVDRELTVMELLLDVAATLGRSAAENTLDPRDELTRVEGLGQVVVGADLEPDDLVDVLVAGGEHQDRHVRGLAHAAADLDPVDVRQHQVEDDQGGRLGGDVRQPSAAGRDRADVVAGVLQVQGHEGGDRGFVLHDQDRLGPGSHQSAAVPTRFFSPRSAPSWKRLRSSGNGLQLARSVRQSSPSSEYTPGSAATGAATIEPTPLATTERSMPRPSIVIRYLPPTSRKRSPTPA